MKETSFLTFWRALPGMPLGLAWRAYRLTRRPEEALQILSPSKRR